MFFRKIIALAFLLSVPAHLAYADKPADLVVESLVLKSPYESASEFPLTPQSGATQSGAPRFGKLAFLGGISLHSNNPAFGGLSALRVTSDGQQALALSDRGRFWDFALNYDQNGRLSGAKLLGNFRMQTNIDGKPLGDGMRDSESMEWSGDGGVLVGFEHRHRIWRFPPSNKGIKTLLPRDAPTAFSAPEDLKNAPTNGGLEALVALTPQGADGPLLAIAEQYLAEMGEVTAVRGWIGDTTGWQELRYKVIEGFRPTDAARLPNGDIVVLERRVQLPFDLATRIVRIKAETIKPNALLESEELIRFTADLPRDNFEGISVRQDDAGKTYIYVVSDDNFNASMLQRTWLLMFGLLP